MLKSLKKLFDKIVFHIKCTFSSSCCVGQKDKGQNAVTDTTKKDVSADLVKQVENQNIYLSDNNIDK
jgi:hypothetical protein